MTLVKRFVYQDVEISIARASGAMGMQRSLLAFGALEEIKDLPEHIQVLRTNVFPDLTAAVIRAKGKLLVPDYENIDPESGEPAMVEIDFGQWPIPFDQFRLLPDDMIVAWEQAAYEQNPHWNPAGLVKEDVEKKV